MGTGIELYGTSEEVKAMAQRFRTTLRGGDKLAVNELLALAQISKVTNLNPFIGEVWYIPGKGPMIGIAGARRLWNEKNANKDGYSFVNIIPCSADEAGATEKDVAAAFRAEAHDSQATGEYQKMFLETLKAMREAGAADPFAEAREIVGKKPVWIGYGYSTLSETSRMNKTQLARKRAEADALKKCISVPFGVDISIDHDAAPEYIDGTATETNSLETIGEENQDTLRDEAAIEIVDTMGDWAVGEAAKFWNLDKKAAAVELGKAKLGKMSKTDFTAWLKEPKS